ncbi:MAG: hypothetical protein NTZ05_00025 [Chloroflexi bacterium]|nr:hypothetical protein [Chloroflexota bacterium]
MYGNLAHGGAATPPRSWRTPAGGLPADPPQDWRVRPRVQGDGAGAA